MMNKTHKKPTIAIIGCGEVGYFYATLFYQANYELVLCAPRLSQQIEAFCSQCNIELHKTPGEWLEKVEIVISCVPGRGHVEELTKRGISK